MGSKRYPFLFMSKLGQYIAQLLLEDSTNISYIKPNFETEWEEAIRYPEFEQIGKEKWLEIAKNGNIVEYSKIKDILGNVDLDFENLEEPKKQRFNKAFEQGKIELPIVAKFTDQKYDLVAGNTRLSGLVKNNIDPKVWVVNIPSMKENLESNQRLTESETGTIQEFIKYACKNLEIQKIPRSLTLSYDTNQVKDRRSFGYFDPNNQKIWVYVKNRNMADILRTLAHELVHHKQNLDGRISYESGKTGSDIENEANAKAGILLRDFGKLNDEIYQ